MLCPLFDVAGKSPNKTAVIFQNREMSYSELNDRIIRFQKYLIQRGVLKDKIVALIGENGIDYIAFLFAIWRIGAVAFPINPKFPFAVIERIVEEHKISLVVSDKERAFSFNKDIHHISFDAIRTNKDDLLFDEINSIIYEKKNALFILTSGSSGKSKTVVLSFENIYYNALSVLELIELSDNDKWLLTLPLFHVGGIAVIIRSVIKGATLIIQDKSILLYENILINKVTHISLVSTQLMNLKESIKKSFHSELNIKAVLLGGSFFSKELLNEAINLGLPIYASYGLSEMAATVTIKKLFTKGEDFNSSGRILKYGKIKIGNSKEILLKGKKLFKGYMENGKVVRKIDSEGWFKSDDTGYINENNELIILGRSDDIFISGGENISPKEIEEIILQMQEIADAKVLPIKDEKYGYIPIVFIDIIDKQSVEIEEIKQYLLKRLPKFKIPNKFYIWPEQEESKIKLTSDDFKSSIKSSNLLK